MKKESKFQAELIEDIKKEFKGAIVLKNDPQYLQGFPDLLVLFKNLWAALECKKSSKATHRPNQDYYIDVLGKMSYANFVYPENKMEVLDDLKRAFKTEG